MSMVRSIPLGRLTLTLRPLTGPDLPVLAHFAREVRRASGVDPDGQGILRPGSRVGWVAETPHRLAGFVLGAVARIYGPATGGALAALAEFFRGLVGRRAVRVLQVQLLDLCVAAEWPRETVERALLGQFDEELRGRGDRIHLIVPESNLSAQLFLRDREYRAVQVLRGCYGTEDGYLMVSPPAGGRGGVHARPPGTKAAADGKREERSRR
jgi:ribosomal protein S18 acetylase RimI-like enzyme